MASEMVRLKYKGSKEDGLPVTYPIGSKQKSAWNKVVWANPFLDVSKEEAEYLLKDSHNWEKASGSDLKAEFENVSKEITKPRARRASVEKVEKKKRGRPKMPPPEVKPQEDTQEIPLPEAPKSKPAKKSARS